MVAGFDFEGSPAARSHARPQAGAGRGARRVVHVVGTVTDEIFSLLGPAALTLARSGLRQTVVLIDHPNYRRHAASLAESADLVLTPRLAHPGHQWRAVWQACRRAVAGGPLHAMHLHGPGPALVGTWVAGTSGLQAPVFYTPHGSRSMAALHLIGAPARWLLGPRASHARRAGIVNLPHEARVGGLWADVQLVESPVAAAFLRVPRQEARHPLIVTGGALQSRRNADLYAQLAVLLGGEGLNIGLQWIGSLGQAGRARLDAAQVAVVAAQSDAECAALMGRAWLYVAPGRTRGFPLYLVDAMAAGLPCVAMDCAQHRDLIVDGVTGYLCATERDLILRIASLIDSPELRLVIGAAARMEALRRFDPENFGAHLLQAYALPAAEGARSGHRAVPAAGLHGS
jgi:glycosyltransferase involved in cell wall biosynthesis